MPPALDRAGEGEQEVRDLSSWTEQAQLRSHHVAGVTAKETARGKCSWNYFNDI